MIFWKEARDDVVWKWLNLFERLFVKGEYEQFITAMLWRWCSNPSGVFRVSIPRHWGCVCHIRGRYDVRCLGSLVWAEPGLFVLDREQPACLRFDVFVVCAIFLLEELLQAVSSETELIEWHFAILVNSFLCIGRKRVNCANTGGTCWNSNRFKGKCLSQGWNQPIRSRSLQRSQ